MDEHAPIRVDDRQHAALEEITAAWHQARDAFEQSERRYRNLVEHSLLDYVVKPVDSQELVNVIVSVIEARH